MNQRTHSWIAIRAVALLEDVSKEKNLVKLLKPHVRLASVGAWIPDQADAKRSGNRTDNHVFKIKPYKGTLKKRFITQKDELIKNIGLYRKTAKFLQSDSYLDSQWWNTPYKGDVPPGQHLPNRAMGLSTMMKDLLILGNKKVDHLIPGDIRFAQYMAPEIRTKEEQAAMYFFMLSHFIADVCMPCHCDERKLAGYSNGLHKELEKYWSRKVGTGFEKKNLVQKKSNLTSRQLNKDSNEVLEQAKKIGEKFNLRFRLNSIPDLKPKHDVWLEVIHLCRASFAIASIIAPYKTYPYNKPKVRAPFEKVFDDSNKQLLNDLNEMVMHDAVLNTAIIWKHIWNKVSKE